MRGVRTALFAITALFAQAQSFQTTVAPLANENLAGPCRYDLTLPAGHHHVRATWVTYDRGRDIMKFYSDPDVVAFAQQNGLALIMAHQCPAKSAPGGPEEMDMDPSHGLGRALFTALDQFARQTSHAELSASKLILLGFSGTGALFAHLVGYAPDRILASMLGDPGHYDPVGVDNVRLRSNALGVPELIMAGGADKVSGTQRPYDYFRRYRDQGAPWAFVAQNRTPHCCIINTKSLMLAWLAEIVKLRQASSTNPLRKIDDSRGWVGYIRTCPSLVRDGWGASTWDVCDAIVQQTERLAPANMIPAGWLPSHAVASKWLAFIKQPAHPTDSLP